MGRPVSTALPVTGVFFLELQVPGSPLGASARRCVEPRLPQQVRRGSGSAGFLGCSVLVGVCLLLSFLSLLPCHFWSEKECVGVSHPRPEPEAPAGSPRPASYLTVTAAQTVMSPGSGCGPAMNSALRFSSSSHALVLVFLFLILGHFSGPLAAGVFFSPGLGMTSF